jgi:predicted ATPase/class 3 adenylate cyclase
MRESFVAVGCPSAEFSRRCKVMSGATVTLLFTDIEGSTRMLDGLRDRYRDVLRAHHRVMRDAIAATGGREVDTAGDSFFVVFSSAQAAVDCAARAQRALASREWPAGERPRVRMGIHTGAPTLEGGTFVGMDVHRAARVMAVAHGGQVLLSEDAAQVLGEPGNLLDLGYHRLKDLPAPEHVFQLVVPGLESAFPRLRSLNRLNVPIPSNPIVGRGDDIARGLELLSEGVRLVTLLGPGGAGKSRLAIELAAQAVERYRDGAWFVSLAQVQDPGLVVTEIARVLEIDPVPGELIEQTVAAALRERELLLVLDNFEHLLAAGPVVADLLARTLRTNVVATSREPLRVRGEYRVDVPPLLLPDACDLFVQRATAVRPEMDLTDDDRAAIERICLRLDRLPLALELAAARAAAFAPVALEARLSERLSLPEGPRDLPERQRTLPATIEWSYQLLTRVERTLMQALAPFVGGVRVGDAEAIWGPEAADGLVSLFEKSLLRRREDPDREPRFWMLETIRQFAVDRVTAEGRIIDAADRHAEHFLGITEDAAARLLSREQRRWVTRLEADHANLRAALRRLIDSDSARAVRMAANLEWFWIVRGYSAEARSWLAEALTSAPDDCPDRARALAAAGQTALQDGHAADAEPFLIEALTIAEQQQDARVAVLALSHLGWAAEAMARHEDSNAHHERAVAAARAAQDDWLLGLALNNYAIKIARAGDLIGARPLLEESLRLGRDAGEPRAIALASCNLAEIVIDVDELDTAEALIKESLTQARECESLPAIGGALITRAVIALRRGDVECAGTHLGGAFAAARSGYDAELIASLLSVAGTTAAIRRQPVGAATLWAAAGRARARIGLPEAPSEEKLRLQWQETARACLDDEAGWNAAWAAGAALSFDDALSLASTLTEITA